MKLPQLKNFIFFFLNHHTKYCRNGKYLRKYFVLFLQINNGYFQTQLFEFMIKIADISDDEISELIDQALIANTKSKLMTTYEQIRHSAMQDNTIRTILKMQKKKMEIGDIAEILEVDEQFVIDVIEGRIKEKRPK